MKLHTTREAFIAPLQRIIGAVERKQIRPILSHVLIRAGDGGVELIATDLEIEMLSTAQAEVEEASPSTLPARKLLDIVKALPSGADVTVEADQERGYVFSGRSRFELMALPAEGFPQKEALRELVAVDVPSLGLADLLDRTAFAMAVEDVRFYLNGLLLEIHADELRSVATDGHRMALAQMPLESGLHEVRQVLIPRKGVQELMRLAAGSQGTARLELAENQLRATLLLAQESFSEPSEESGEGSGVVRFASKLIDARFPDYERVLPTHSNKTLMINRKGFLEALQRVSILANERLRGVRMTLRRDELLLQSRNAEHEQAQEVLDVDYDGPELVIGFNVSYLLDALQALRSEVARMGLSDPAAAALIEAPDDPNARYVVMPMKL